MDDAGGGEGGFRDQTGSSQWMKVQEVRGFAWQRGYGLYSVSPAHLGVLMGYIDGQKVHHAKEDYQAEMREFYARYHVAFDEKYAWD